MKASAVMCSQQKDRNKPILKYKNENMEVWVKKTKIGAWKAWIKDLQTGAERSGFYVPGDPKDYDFDPKTEGWIAK